MRVAAVQFCPVFKDIQSNINTMEGLVAEAAKKGAELIVLPELATCGYSFLSNSEARPFCEGLESQSSPSIKAMTEASNGLGVAIAWGFIERGLGGEDLHNAQGLVLPGQGLAAKYHKNNLWGNDHLWGTAGTLSPPIVTWKSKKVGLLICRDIRDRSESDKDFYEAGDADVIAFSANFGKGGFLASAWMSFVKDNKIPLVVSNRYGLEENNDFGQGGVCIIHPSGKVDCDGLKWNAPCIVYSDI